MFSKTIVVAFMFLILSNVRAQPASVPTEAEVEAAISSSDDFTHNKQAFLSVTSSLVKNGTCSLSELKEMGGWVKSQKHKNKPVYFTYCGGMHISKKIYLNASTMQVFRENGEKVNLLKETK